eukprot:TRINITY_DN5551_c0_g1_i2.p1 TRINITY_DN5551_c0_g1~~TRINITY_DN5551_c0_g1_i2.p1  ORF type:complete len:216 (+),score=28.18 TRINITY_DN5551_c0_g1_i2:69-650(+)
MSELIDYGSSEYWDNRYENEPEPFEWFLNYEALKPYITKRIPYDSLVLQIGCGNSVLPEDMAADGYKKICNIDLSQVVIETMKKKYQSTKNLEFRRMDCRSLEFSDNTFDGVIDKGTMDTIMCGDNSFVNAAKMLNQIHRVLKPGGVFMEITYGAPETRVEHFENISGWTLEKEILKKQSEGCHYLYILTKKV